eukprot:3319831-Amphidinium_carterae.1
MASTRFYQQLRGLLHEGITSGNTSSLLARAAISGEESSLSVHHTALLTKEGKRVLKLTSEAYGGRRKAI